MNLDQQNVEQVSLSAEEQFIVEVIRKNPTLKKSIGKTIANFNCEVGKGINELEAELMVTDMVKKIGSDLITDWASQSQKTSVEKALHSGQKIKRGKKNDTGIPPLE